VEDGGGRVVRGEQCWQWIKLKRDYRIELADTIDLVVVGAFAGRGRRRGVFGASAGLVRGRRARRLADQPLAAIRDRRLEGGVQLVGGADPRPCGCPKLRTQPLTWCFLQVRLPG
jgi:hypothetical protein